jgi:hypothetical protein
MAKATPAADNRDIALVLREDFGVKNWDIAIVGDGSGSGWQIGCGWAGVLIDGLTQQRYPFWGGSNVGTVNIGESMPYLQAMIWFAATLGGERKELLGRPIEVHCITDSKTTCHHGNDVMQRNEKSPRILRKYPQWNILHGLIANGYHFRFHWKDRMTLGLNNLADYLAGASRLAVQGVPFPQLDGQPLPLHSLNSIVSGPATDGATRT